MIDRDKEADHRTRKRLPVLEAVRVGVASPRKLSLTRTSALWATLRLSSYTRRDEKHLVGKTDEADLHFTRGDIPVMRRYLDAVEKLLNQPFKED